VPYGIEFVVPNSNGGWEYAQGKVFSGLDIRWREMIAELHLSTDNSGKEELLLKLPIYQGDNLVGHTEFYKMFPNCIADITLIEQ
jgi:hypothetical protein